MLDFLSLINNQNFPLILVIASFGLIIFYLLYQYEGWGEKKHVKVRESERQEEYECPRCGEFVDAETTECPECGAEFEEEIFSCPVCGTSITDEHEECPECEEKFIVEEPEYECPKCAEPVDKYATECEKCGANFWSPVRRSNVGDDDKFEDKKIDSTHIEIVEE